MPARVVSDLSDAQRQALRKHNARYTFHMGVTGDDKQTLLPPETEPSETESDDRALHCCCALSCCSALHCCGALQYIHHAMVVIMAGFVIGIGVMWDNHPYTVALTSMVYMFDFPSGHAYKSLRDFKTVVQNDFCKEEYNHDMYQLSLYNLNALPVTVSSSIELSIWGMLMAVFVITFLFEVYRCKISFIEGITPNFLHFSPADGPDLSRWLEYALTSPLQIIIVAISFHIRDASQLLTLGLLQALLVIMGYAIEREIDAWNRHRIVEKDTEKKHNYSPAAGFILFAFSTMAHIAIWLIIKTRLESEMHAVKHCTNKERHDRQQMFNDFRNILVYIWGAQVALFSVFGLVAFGTFVSSVRSHTVEDLNRVWRHTTRWYSILSVTAKVVLAILLFVYASQLFSLLLTNWVDESPPPTTTPAPSGG